MNETFGQRLRRARIHAGLTQQELATASKCGTQLNISKLERSGAEGSRFALQYAQACGVSAQWLIKGEGPMIEETGPDEGRLIKLYRSASSQNQRAILQVAESLAQSNATDNAPDHTPNTQESAQDDETLLQNYRIELRKQRRTKRHVA